MATFTSNAGPYTLILDVYENANSMNITNNTTSVHWTLQMRADGAYCQWNPGPGDFHVKLNGSVVWSAENPSLWYSGIGGTLTLASGNTTIGHNSDGSKTIYCEGKYAANSNANYLPKSSTCGGNLTLSTIPRASSFKKFTGNTIGSSQTIEIERKSSSFTHSLWYKIGNGSWVSIGSGIGTSHTWTLPTSLNNQIPNATSLTLTYILRTYNGSTAIGSDVTYNYTVYYSGNNPNAGSVGITYANLFNNKFIANHSTATINYSGYSGVYGSTISSAQVIFNGSWKGVTSYGTGKLTAGTYSFQGVATDSRNKTVYTSQQSFTCYQINNPSVSINAYRSDVNGNADPGGTYITIIPTYSAHDPVGGNSIKSNSFTCTSLMTTATAITSGTKKIISGANVDSEYVISGSVTDQLGRSSSTSIKIGTAFSLWDIRPDEKGMSFGKYSSGPDKFEVGWNAYFDQNVNCKELSSASLTTSNFYNNTVQIKDTTFSGEGKMESYLKLFTIKVLQAYVNTPLEICFSQRGCVTVTRIFIRFENVSSMDPNINTFYHFGDTKGLYAVKESTSTWAIYLRKSEAWCGVDNYYVLRPKWCFQVSYIGTNAASVPAGYKAAVDYYLRSDAAEYNIGSFRLAKQYLGFYNSHSDAVVHSNRKGWIGNDGSTKFHIRGECDAGIEIRPERGALNLITETPYNIYLQSPRSVMFDSGGKKIWFECHSEVANPAFRVQGADTGVVYLGLSSARWKTLYCVNSVNASSDRNLKKNIEPLDERYEKLFMDLKPVRYMFKREGSDRYHTGFISQDVHQSMEDYGISDLELGAFCKDRKTVSFIDEEGNEILHEKKVREGEDPYEYSLRYEEFISITAHMVQKLYREVETLKGEIVTLKEEILSLKTDANQ